MKKRLILIMFLALSLLLTFTSCEWFNTLESHKCESVCQECGNCLNTECSDEACAEKCEGHIPPHECEHFCEECDGCLDAKCAEDVCTTKCTCHNRDTLCPECGGCIDTDFCTYEGCNVKCTCERYVNVSKELADLLTHHLCIHKVDIDPNIFNLSETWLSAGQA